MKAAPFPADVKWQTCKQAGVACPICGKSRSCNVSPDRTAFKCWRDGGKVHQLNARPTRRKELSSDGRHQKPRPANRTFISAATAIAAYRKGRPTAAWTYRDAEGTDILVIARWDEPDGGKTIRPAGFVGTGWIQGDPGAPFPLFRLCELLAANAAEPVVVCEGEKAVDAAASIGLLATTSAHGSSQAKRSDWTALAGRDVIILPDNDEAGAGYAADVAEILGNLEPPAKVRIVDLPNLPEGGDIVEYLEQLDCKEPEELRSGILALAAQARPVGPDVPQIVSAAAAIAQYPKLRPVLIHGLLRQSETINLIASPKSHKTYLAMNLAVCVATGRAVLGILSVENAGPVLYVDCELHPETWATRLAMVCSSMGVMRDQMDGVLDVVNLRGRLRDLMSLRPMLTTFPKGRYRLIVLDALYRLLPADVDENSNADVTRLYNVLDEYAAMTGAAFLVVHHASKGSQGNKGVTDVGAGAGAQSRAADAHLIIRPHETPAAAVLEAVVRSFPPLPAMCVRWEYPLWKLAPDLNPADLKIEGRRKRKPAEAEADAKPEAPEWMPDTFAQSFLTQDLKPKEYILAKAVAAGMKRRQAESLLTCAVEDGVAIETRIKATGSPRRYRRP